MQQRAVVPEYREVCTFRNFFGVLLLLHPVRRNPNSVIVLQRKVDGFAEIDFAQRSCARLLPRRL
jgi:hypothetical protein